MLSIPHISASDIVCMKCAGAGAFLTWNKFFEMFAQELRRIDEELIKVMCAQDTLAHDLYARLLSDRKWEILRQKRMKRTRQYAEMMGGHSDPHFISRVSGLLFRKPLERKIYISMSKKDKIVDQEVCLARSAHLDVGFAELLVERDLLVARLGVYKFLTNREVYRRGVEEKRIKDAMTLALNDTRSLAISELVGRIMKMIIVNSRKHQQGIVKDLNWEFEEKKCATNSSKNKGVNKSLARMKKKKK